MSTQQQTPFCNVKHPEKNVFCVMTEENHGVGHGGFENGELVHWTERPKPKLTKTQLKSLIQQHEEGLDHTLSSVQGDRSAMSDIVRTVVPIHKKQLDILKGVLDLIGDDA